MRRLFALPALILVGCGGTPASRLPDDPDRVVVFSIDGPSFNRNEGVLTEAQEKGEILNGYPVLGKVEVADPDQRRAIVAAIKAGANYKGPEAKCFEPRHIVRVERAGRSLDVLICFHCSNYFIRRDENDKRMDGGPMSNEAEPLLNKLLADAGVPIAP